MECEQDGRMGLPGALAVLRRSNQQLLPPHTCIRRREHQGVEGPHAPETGTEYLRTLPRARARTVVAKILKKCARMTSQKGGRRG